MRILHVQPGLDIGGASTMVVQLARQQKLQGHDVAICSLYKEDTLDAMAAEYGIPVIHLHSTRSLLNQASNLRKHLAANPVDVLHSHWRGWFAGAVAGATRGIPRVHTHHSNESRHRVPEYRLASMLTNKIAVLIPRVEPFLSKWVGTPQRKIVIIPNGIDTEPIERSVRIEIDGIPSDAPVVGMVARLSRPKDYSTLIRSAAIVAKTAPHVHFVGVGDGPQRDQFEQEVAALGLTNFHFLGPRNDVPNLLRRFTVNVLATLNEGLPISLLEAMASGLPCIASDIPANRFPLDEGKAGILVPGQNPEALAEAILRVVNDKPFHDEMAAKALDHAKQFTAPTMARNYEDLYRSVVK